MAETKRKVKNPMHFRNTKLSKIYFLQRERKHKKLYSDDLDFVDDELEAGRGFSLQEKLDSPKFSMDLFVLQMTGNEVTVEYFQRCGKFLKLVGGGGGNYNKSLCGFKLKKTFGKQSFLL